MEVVEDLTLDDAVADEPAADPVDPGAEEGMREREGPAPADLGPAPVARLGQERGRGHAGAEGDQRFLGEDDPAALDLELELALGLDDGLLLGEARVPAVLRVHRGR